MPEATATLIQDSSSIISAEMVETALDKGLDFAFTKLALKAPPPLQSTIYAVSSYAAAEFLQLVGIGAGFTSLNSTGFTLAQINKKLDEIKAQLDKILGAPAILALDHFKRGVYCLDAGNYATANKEFDKVVDLAMTGVYYEKEKIQTVANLTNYLIVADLMLSSFDRKKEYFQRYELLNTNTKIEIKRKVTDHMEKLLDAQIKQEPGFFSLSKQKKKEANQNVVDGVLQNALQFVSPPGKPVPVKFIPEGFEDAALLNLDGKPGKLDSSSIYIWRNGKKVMIRHGVTAKTSEIDTKEEDELTIVANASGVSRDGRPLAIMDNNKQNQELSDASLDGNNAKVQALLMSGADVNAVDGEGLTPLMMASYKGHSDVVTTLLNHPLIQINMGVRGYTALHQVAANGRLNVAKQLVTAGADLTLVYKTNERSPGRTAAQVAKSSRKGSRKHDVYNYLSNL